MNCLINGNFQDQLSLFDRGLAYGDGVFRTFRLTPPLFFEHLNFFWQLQFDKLRADAEALAISCSEPDLLLSDIMRLLDQEKDTKDCVIKMMMTRGISERGYAVCQQYASTRIVIKSALPQYPESIYTDGVMVRVCHLRLAYQPALAGIKHLNRLENVLARSEWQDTAIFEGILLDQEDFVIGGVMSNLFMRIGERLITPDLSLAGVAGIARQKIWHCANQFGLQCEIRRFKLPELLKADEVLLCNSVFGVVQVVCLVDQYWEKGRLADVLRNYLLYGFE